MSLNAKMKIIIETPRLILRELSTNDAQNFYELNLNPRVIEFTGDTAFASIDESKNFLQNYSDYQKNGFGRWVVIEKTTNEFLGWCGLKYDSEKNETDIGFRFFEKHWNKGFATESAKACLDYGFKELQLQSIVGRAMKNNLASIKVLEKIGMSYQKEINSGRKEWVIYKMEM